MNSLQSTEVGNNPQLLSSTQQTVDLLRPTANMIVEIDKLPNEVNYLCHDYSFIFGQTAGLDVQGRIGPDGKTPQSGIISFAKQLGIRQEELIMPKLDAHTTDVLVVDSLEQLRYVPAEGRTVSYNAQKETTLIDSLIIIKNPDTEDFVLAITGADCPAVVGSAELADGRIVIFGIHAGRKGCLGGIIENTAAELINLGVVPGTVHLAVGPGGQTLELPLKTLLEEAAENKHTITSDIWQESATISFNYLANKDQEMRIYDNQADVIRRTQLAFGQLLSPNGFAIINANTLTGDGLKSYRGTTIEKNASDDIEAKNAWPEAGRNALFTRFSFEKLKLILE